MKTVFFQGTFDLINYGHIMGFKDAKAQGDYLIVGLNTDELVKEYKHRETILPYYQRKAILESLKYVDEIVLCDKFSPLEILQKMDIDVYVVYDEWLETKQEEIAYMNLSGKKVFITHDYRGAIHSSEIRKRCCSQQYTGSDV